MKFIAPVAAGGLTGTRNHVLGQHLSERGDSRCWWSIGRASLEAADLRLTALILCLLPAPEGRVADAGDLCDTNPRPRGGVRLYRRPLNHGAESIFLLQNGQIAKALLPTARRKSALQFGQVTVTRSTAGARGVDCVLSVHFIDDFLGGAISLADRTSSTSPSSTPCASRLPPG